jgi:alkylation response protein AidB-like acyl-CoA dehydrogenase
MTQFSLIEVSSMTMTYQSTDSARSVFAPAMDSRFAIDDELLDRARALEPIIREHAEMTERGRRLAPAVIDAMRAAGLFRMFTPRSLGGLEVDPITAARVAEEIASFDSAAAWSLQAGNTGAWWAARFTEEGVAEIFADGPDLLAAASFSPPHRAEEVPGGFRLSGRGPLASTIHDSAWVMMTGIVFDGEQPRMTPMGPAIVALLMRTTEVEIVDTWHSLGLRGTDSNDVAANGVFVPTSRSFFVSPMFEPNRHFSGPLYRLPALASVDVVVVPVALAIARAAITELRNVSDRKTPLGSMKTLRHRASVQRALADGEARLRSARLLFYDAVTASWQRALSGEPATLEHKADLMLASAHAVHSAAEVVDLMHRVAGTSGIYTRSRLERHFRDAQTIRHHGFVCESRLETVGQVYLGVEPEFGFVAF